MKTFKVGDRVMAVKDSRLGAPFNKGWIGTIKSTFTGTPPYGITFDNLNDEIWYATPDEIQLIEEPEHKPFPSFEEFDEWFYFRWDSEMKTLYNYFAQFGTQPNQLEQLKARKSELSREELLELVELMEGNDG